MRRWFRLSWPAGRTITPALAPPAARSHVIPLGACLTCMCDPRHACTRCRRGKDGGTELCARRCFDQ